MVHLDFHAGLGKYGQCKLLTSPDIGADQLEQYRVLFDSPVERAGQEGGIAYRMRGNLGRFVTTIMSDRHYYFLFVEFGTYSAIRVLAALRRENQAHFFTPPGSRAQQQAKAELLECFCPASSSWRRSVADQSTELIDRAQQIAAALASKY